MSSSRVKNGSENLLMDLFNYGVSNVQPRNILKNFIKIDKAKIIVKNNAYSKTYENFKNVIPICVGKASVDMGNTALSLLKNFENEVSEGVIVVNKENFKKVKGFKCFSSGHPIPNKNGLLASYHIENKLNSLSEKDLVLFFLSGGGSALLPYPSANIKITQKVSLNHQLLNSGADIKEINTVRKHLSKIKGGNLLKMSFPAKVHSFILSDVIGDDLSSISSGPTVPDETSFDDAKRILRKYKLWNDIHKSIKEHIELGILNKSLETPDKTNKVFLTVENTLIGSNNLCLKSIDSLCKKKKINSKIWKNNIEGDVQIIAKNFVQDLKKKNYKKPIILISGGESTVKIKGTGKGGRNQEFALHFLKNIRKSFSNLEFTLLSAGTDGRDGPTNAAGAIVNNKSLDLIINKKINLEKELENNNSYQVLKKIDSLVIIKGTNTNVADIQLLMIN